MLLPVEQPIQILRCPLFDRHTALLQSIAIDQCGQFIHRQSERMTHRMNRPTSLSYRMTQRDVRRVAQLLRHGMCLQNCLLCLRHLHLALCPQSGQFHRLHRALLLRIAKSKLLRYPPRLFERPQHHYPPLLSLYQHRQFTQEGTVLGKQNLILPLFMLADLFHPVHALATSPTKLILSLG